MIGLLIRARLEEKIPTLDEELKRLRDEAGFRIDDQLYRLALDAVGE